MIGSLRGMRGMSSLKQKSDRDTVNHGTPAKCGSELRLTENRREPVSNLWALDESVSLRSVMISGTDTVTM